MPRKKKKIGDQKATKAIRKILVELGIPSLGILGSNEDVRMLMRLAYLEGHIDGLAEAIKCQSKKISFAKR